jgi:hypothetical protein
MNRTLDGIVSWLWVALGVSRAAVADVARHWVMASFSLVAGFGVWFAIQDVENPRITQVVTFQAGEGIPIEGRNVPDGYLFEGGTVTQVRVEAREREIEDLVADDFEAWVDLSGAEPAVEGRFVVNVRSRRDGVRVREADPAVLPVQLVRAEVVPDVQVRMNTTGALPDGYELVADETEIEPAFVTLTGTPEQIASISSVQIDVDLSGRRDETSTFEGDLVARSSSGDAVTVKIDPPRAKVTMTIRQTFSQRQLPVVAPITGHPAAGYEIARTVYEPSTVVVSGLKSVMDGLTQIVVEPVDVAGRPRTSHRPGRSASPTRRPSRRPSWSVSRSDPWSATSQQSKGCATRTFAVGVTLQSPPTGLTYAAGTYMTQVHVTGSLAALQELSAVDFVASASLANGTPGTASYAVAVVPPQGIRVDSVDPVTIMLIAGP